jgi:NitT/TauT family transport system permease protein
LLFFALWEAVCRVLRVPDFILPAPSAALAALWQYWTPIRINAGYTLVSTLIGFAMAVLFGGLLGLAIGASALLYRALNPLLIGFNSIPKVALVPVLVMWFGTGTIPAVLAAFLLAFFPITVNVALGIATIEPELADVLRALGASRLDVLRKIGLPRTLPYFFASLKIAIALAFVGSIISETIAANEGIGFLMVSASSSFRVPLVFAALLVVAAMGVAMYLAASLLEQHFIRWSRRPPQMVEAGS